MAKTIKSIRLKSIEGNLHIEEFWGNEAASERYSLLDSLELRVRNAGVPAGDVPAAAAGWFLKMVLRDTVAVKPAEVHVKIRGRYADITPELDHIMPQLVGDSWEELKAYYGDKNEHGTDSNQRG